MVSENRIAVPEAGLKLAKKLNVVSEVHSEDFIYHFVERRAGWQGFLYDLTAVRGSFVRLI